MAQVVTTESVSNMRNRKGQEVEHFGFADSVSQPLFFKQQVENARREKYDPAEPLKLVVVRDPNGKYPYSCGSYLAVRKLRQDVKLFEKQLETLAATLKIDPELAGAYVIGRFRDGTPVAQASAPQGAAPVPNDFNFDDDQDGSKCPFQAHIHKMNPRGSSGDRFETRPPDRAAEHDVRGRRRREVAPGYGRWHAVHVLSSEHRQPVRVPAGGVGQLARLPTNQDRPRPPGRATIEGGARSGQDQKVEGDETPSYPKEWGKPDRQPLGLDRCVSMRGGEYFFSPSLSFLQNLE